MGHWLDETASAFYSGRLTRRQVLVRAAATVAGTMVSAAVTPISAFAQPRRCGNGVSCPHGQGCCGTMCISYSDPRLRCCFGGVYDWYEEECCPNGHVCAGHGKCCGERCCHGSLVGPMCCENKTCYNLLFQHCCPGGTICSTTETCCGTACCKHHERCCDSTCCPRDEKCCGSSCCRAGELCCDGHCCPEGEICCGGKTCTEPHKCGPGGTHVCNPPCPEGGTCCQGGGGNPNYCAGKGLSCCANSCSYAGPNDICCPTGDCVGEAGKNVLCGGGLPAGGDTHMYCAIHCAGQPGATKVPCCSGGKIGCLCTDGTCCAGDCACQPDGTCKPTYGHTHC